MPAELTETERAICEALALDPLSIDSLLAALGSPDLALGDLMSALLQLELRGLVRQEPGKRFRRVR